MRKGTRIWICIACAMIAVGLALCAAVMTAYQWDFTKLSTEEYEMKSYEFIDDIVRIEVKSGTASVRFVPSEDGICRVICYDQPRLWYSVTVENGTLTVFPVDERKWYEYIGIGFRSPEITVELAAAEYAALSITGDTGDVEVPREFCFGTAEIAFSTGDVRFSASVVDALRISTSTGNIRVGDLTAGAVELSVSTGGVTVTDLTCRGGVSVKVSTGKTVLSGVRCTHFTSRGSTGALTLTDVIADGAFTISRSTGSVKFDGADAAEISVTTDTGSVTGRLLTGKNFRVSSDTGSVEVPEGTDGGLCEIRTDTGNIRIRVSETQ